MTSDQRNPLEEDVLCALRRRARAEAPKAARARVAARLSGAGVGVLATATSAAAASSVKAAGSAGALSALSLSKTFALGLALGVGTAVTTYAVSSERALRLPQAPIATNTAASQAVSVGTAAADRGAAPVEQAPEPVSTAPHIDPTPELPHAPRPAAPARSSVPRGDATHGLAEQQALLDGARRLLRTGDARRALDTVEQHRARFPRTAFEEERQALAIRALVALGRNSEARTRTEDFARRFPGSLALRALRETSAASAIHETVTEPKAPSQTPSEGSALR